MTTYLKQFIRFCAVPELLSLVYHLQKNMIINPIKLCNPSVADPEEAAPSIHYHPQKLLIWAFVWSRKHHFKP